MTHQSSARGMARLALAAVAAAVTAAFVTTIASPAEAAILPRPQVNVGRPANLAPLYYDLAPFNVTLEYDAATESLPVAGSFSGLPKRLFDANVFQVVLTSGFNQVVAPMIALPGVTTIGRVETVHGLFYTMVPIPFDDIWPLRPIVAEIWDGRRRVLARSIVHIHDFRGNPEAVVDFPVEETVRGMTAQLTDPGIGYVTNQVGLEGLEPTVFDLEPYPSLAELNDRLTNRAQEIPTYDDDDALLEDCIDFDDLAEPNFSDPLAFPAYAAALDAAESSFDEWRAQKAACQLILNPAVQAACLLTLSAYCVTSPPTSSDFELCVDQVEGDVTSLSIEGVDDLSLRIRQPDLANTGRIDLDVTLTGLRGTIDGRLRSLFVRWKDPLCLTRVRSDLDDAAIPEREWLDDWATCENLELRNEIASTVLGAGGAGAPGHYVVDADPADVERPLVQLGTEGDFGFELPSVDAARGTCGETFVREDVEAMIRTFRAPMQLRLQNTWYRESPDTPEALVLTKLLSPLEPGGLPITDADIVTELAVNHSQVGAGLGFMWDTTLDSSRPDLLPNRKPVSLHAPPRSPAYSENGLDHLENSFDFAYSITTGLLDKVLNVRAASPDTLHMIYAPTWAELAPFGVRTPAGVDPESAAVLDRRTLARFDRAFGSIGRAVLQIRVRPVIDPIVWMREPSELFPAQPPLEIVDVGEPLAYGIARFEVEFFEAAHAGPQGEAVPEKTWVRLLGGFVDRDFRLRIDADPAALYLVPDLDEHAWDFGIVENALRGAFDLPDLEAKVSQLIDTRFTPVFEQMLSEIPAPKFFDAAGESGEAREFAPRSREQRNQNVIWHGNFRRP